MNSTPLQKANKSVHNRKNYHYMYFHDREFTVRDLADIVFTESINITNAIMAAGQQISNDIRECSGNEPLPDYRSEPT